MTTARSLIGDVFDVTTRCRTCRTPVVPGHTGHDGPLMDGEEAFWCEDCCPHCTNERRRK